MASVTLDRVFLHAADDLSVYLAFFTTSRGDSGSVPGEVRGYANGRQRIVTKAGKSRTLQVTLRLVTDEDLETLNEWRGALLMFRDHRGRLVFGTYFAVDVTDYKDRSGYDVALTFVESTHAVAV